MHQHSKILLKMILEISCFLYFPIRHHVESLCWEGLEDRGTSQCQIFSKLVHPWQKYCDFSIFQWPPPPPWILEFAKFYWLPESRGLIRITVPDFVKIDQSVMGILQFFIKMAATIILDFWNREILLANGIQRVEVHQHAKYRQNLLIGCEDIKIFLFFKMAAAAILDCRIRKILLAYGVWRAQTHHCTKFRFYNVNILIFGTFGWKTFIHAPKIGVFGQFEPLNGLQYQPQPKRHILA